MNILTTLAATGIPGFFSYVYLSQLGILTYTKDSKDEKVIVLSILSILNMGISYLVYYGITGVEPFIEIKLKKILLLFCIAVIVSLLMTVIVYPYCINMMTKYIQSYQKKHNIANRSSKTVYELVLFPQKYENTFVYIFDFEDRFIESGFVYRLSELNDKIQFTITTTTAHVKEKFEIEEVLSIFNETENEKAELIIDTDRKLKLFVFYS